VYTADTAAFPDVLAPPTGVHLTGFVPDSIAYFVDAIVRGAPCPVITVRSTHDRVGD
jgi:hypothetical protein